MGQTNGFSSCKRPTAHLLCGPVVKVEHFSREKKSEAGNKAVRSLEGKGVFFLDILNNCPRKHLLLSYAVYGNKQLTILDLQKYKKVL